MMFGPLVGHSAYDLQRNQLLELVSGKGVLENVAYRAQISCPAPGPVDGRFRGIGVLDSVSEAEDDAERSQTEFAPARFADTHNIFAFWAGLPLVPARVSEERPLGKRALRRIKPIDEELYD